MVNRNHPKISIVTPSLNQGDLIEETIQSVLSQTYPNFEYIIVDGGSTDGSVAIIEKYQHELSYWVSEPDKGQSDAINKGFERGTGDLLCWVNSDDVLFPHCLENIAACYIKKNQPDIIHAWGVYIDAAGKITRLMRVPRQSRFFFFKGSWVAPSPTIFFRASLFRKIGGLDTRYRLSMDLDMWVKMMRANAKVALVPKYLGAFRWSSLNKTSVSISGKAVKSQENPETRQILNKALHGFPETRRRCWYTMWWRLYQLVNLNYLRSYLETQRVKHRYWREVFDD